MIMITALPAKRALSDVKNCEIPSLGFAASLKHLPRVGDKLSCFLTWKVETILSCRHVLRI